MRHSNDAGEQVSGYLLRGVVTALRGKCEKRVTKTLKHINFRLGAEAGLVGKSRFTPGILKNA